uniref:protein-histidine N-methyltransferase n=1 Tax=Clastoptera arizonana TaxID=38151 RepID=A0A1B6DZK1_9HEMI
MSNFCFKFSSDASETLTSILEPNVCNKVEWLPAKEILLDDCVHQTTGKKSIFKVNDLVVFYVVSSDENNHVVSIDKYNQSDLIPAKYEGGMKIWECTYDLVNYLSTSDKPINFEKKSVLDLGCGAGYLGLTAFKLGAESIHFQDYNEEVLYQLTIPNLISNIDKENDSSNFKFFTGDWESFVKLNNFQYDIILTSETIYNTQNHRKLHMTLKKKLKKDGIIFLAAKTYYFGVGGGTRQFEALVNEEGVFDSTVCWKCSSGNIKKIKLIFLKKNDSQ